MTFRAYNPLIANACGGLHGPPSIALQPPYSSEYISRPLVGSRSGCIGELGALGDVASTQCKMPGGSGPYFIPKEAVDWMDAQKSDIVKAWIAQEGMKYETIVQKNPDCFFDETGRMKQCITQPCYALVKPVFEEIASYFPENLRQKIIKEAEGWMLPSTITPPSYATIPPTTPATTQATTKPEEPGLPWGWIIGGGVALTILGVVLYKRKR